MLRGLLIAGPAGVGYDHGNIAEVCSVPHCGLYSDLGRNADDSKGLQAEVSQGHIEKGAFKGAHGDLVGDGFTGNRREFRHDLGLRRIGEEISPPQHFRPAARPSAGEAGKTSCVCVPTIMCCSTTALYL